MPVVGLSLACPCNDIDGLRRRLALAWSLINLSSKEARSVCCISSGYLISFIFSSLWIIIIIKEWILLRTDC